jgi:hypothetical protein
MTFIFAITGDDRTDWVSLGHTREMAEEAFKANLYFFPKPLYRIVARRR